MPKNDLNDEEFEIEDTDDVVYDETEGKTSDKLMKIKEDLKVCRKERQEYLDGWQRAKADFLNLKKRSAEEKAGVGSRASEGFILDLLPTLDSFEMAFKNKESWESAPEQWRKGIEYIHTQLTNILDTYGVETIDPVGKEFDHNEHHSVDSVDVEDEDQDGIVVEVALKGYKTEESVIRPANVKVGSYSQ